MTNTDGAPGMIAAAQEALVKAGQAAGIERRIAELRAGLEKI